MTDLVLSQGVRVINGVEMMGSRKLMSICGVGDHKHFVRDLKVLFKVQNLDFSDIKGVFVELHEEGPKKGCIKEIWFDRPRASAVAGSYDFQFNLYVHEEFDKLSNQKKIPSLPTDFISALEALLDSKKAEQKALAQAEYQDRALTTSQVKNGALTKTVKKLKNQLRGYDEYVSLNSFLAINKISLWDRDKKVQSSSKGLVAKLKKMGLDGNEWILKTFEGQEFPTTVFDPDFLANHIDFIMGEIERLIKGKRPQQTQESV